MVDFKKAFAKKKREWARNRAEKRKFETELRKKRVVAYKKEALKQETMLGKKLAKQKYNPKIVKKVQTADQKKAKELFNKLAYG